MELFLCGDVMTGRGLDQVMPHPCDPTIYERGTTSALTYVELAERASGPIPRAVEPRYIWGDALGEITSRSDVRLVNLETSITSHGRPFPKGINYHMHPANTGCLLVAGIRCCTLANNHVLDWGIPGFLETLEVLERSGIRVAGAGRNLDEASRPVAVESPSGRLLVCAFGAGTSGIPASWGATKVSPGVALLPDLSNRTADLIADAIRPRKGPRDVAVVSIHWGANWGYPVPAEHRAFAHRLVDSGQVDVVHGHSSHHAKGIEVYRGRLILYGCGDFINDYEGISGYEEFSPKLVLAYFCSIDGESGRLDRLEMVAFRSVRFRLRHATPEETSRLAVTLNREGTVMGTSVEITASGTLELQWR